MTATAENSLHQRGILVIPDFIANAGGVICASVEYHGGTEKQARAAIEENIRRNTMEVLQQSRDKAIRPRQAASALAESRVREAMALRKFYRYRH
jgi:glutamate dehydrogenase (NAD(P)+)